MKKALAIKRGIKLSSIVFVFFIVATCLIPFLGSCFPAIKISYALKSAIFGLFLSGSPLIVLSIMDDKLKSQHFPQ